jgi:hypothetical protein
MAKPSKKVRTVVTIIVVFLEKISLSGWEDK